MCDDEWQGTNRYILRISYPGPGSNKIGKKFCQNWTLTISRHQSMDTSFSSCFPQLSQSGLSRTDSVYPAVSQYCWWRADGTCSRRLGSQLPPNDILGKYAWHRTFPRNLREKRKGTNCLRWLSHGYLEKKNNLRMLTSNGISKMCDDHSIYKMRWDVIQLRPNNI